MFSKKTLRFAGILLLFAICATGLSVSGKRGHSSYASDAAILFIGPFQETATASMKFVRDIWRRYFFLVSVAETNVDLRQALSYAVEKNSQCREIALSNYRLRSLLDFRETVTPRVVAAEVISTDPSPWFKSVYINKGKSDGIEKGMAVVIPEGIAGLITEVSYFYSRAVLVTDQNSAVDALIQRTRARGVIRGNSAEACHFKYVLRKHEVVRGDSVISSGLDGVFPKGLPVGKVKEVSRNNSGIFQEVIVSPCADFERLEEVLVILDRPGIRRPDASPSPGNREGGPVARRP